MARLAAACDIGASRLRRRRRGERAAAAGVSDPGVAGVSGR